MVCQAFQLVNTLRHWKGNVPREGIEALNPASDLGLYLSSIWLLMSCMFCGKLGTVKSLPQFCEPFLQAAKPEEFVVGTFSQKGSSVGNLGATFVTGLCREGNLLGLSP